MKATTATTATSWEVRLDNLTINNFPIGIQKNRHGLYTVWVPQPQNVGSYKYLKAAKKRLQQFIGKI